MSSSNITTGKQNSIALSGGGAQTEAPQYLGSAPVFARSRDEPEPNCVVGERLQEPKARPAPKPTRSRIEAQRRGHAVETAGISQAEIDQADADLLAAEKAAEKAAAKERRSRR